MSFQLPDPSARRQLDRFAPLPEGFGAFASICSTCFVFAAAPVSPVAFEKLTEPISASGFSRLGDQPSDIIIVIICAYGNGESSSVEGPSRFCCA